MQPMKRLVYVGGVFVLLLGAFVGWYSIAANYDYEAVSGTYRLQLNGAESSLVLNRDRSFQQELKHDGRVEQSHGTWRRIGEGGIVFSKEFLVLPGQVTRPDGQAFGEVKKSLGLFMSIALTPNPGGPVFHKKLLR